MIDSRFHQQFVALFDASYARLYRYLDRLSGEPELAADLAQDAFVSLYRRGALPERPNAWLITVALNLFRNAKTSRARRLRLLTNARAQDVQSEPALPADDAVAADESRLRVRGALDRLPDRERSLLLLRAEGYSYHEIAVALDLNEASVGTLLARAKRAFRNTYEEANASI